MRVFVLAVALCVLCASGLTAAPTLVSGTIKFIRTGWNSEQFAIVTNEPIKNPAHCPTPDGYLTDSTQSGYNTYYVAAITAFVERARVVVIVDESACLANRPKLIGLDIYR